MQYMYGQTLQWGENSKVGISKSDIDKIIKSYVIQQYPNKVKEYHDKLYQKRLNKLKKFKDVVYISGDLMWQDTQENIDLKDSKLAAKLYCRKLTHASKQDWRLPTYEELLTLVHYFRTNPAVIDELNYIIPKKYWTSSDNISDISAIWYVDFKYGQTGSELKYSKLNIRCVRDISDIEGEI